MTQTKNHEPPMEPSDEADSKQLEQARAQGEAYYRALRYMVEEVAHTGGETRAGDMIVAFAQEEAEGMYALQDGELTWLEPGDDNCHFEVAVLDAADKRFLPGLKVELTVIDDDGDEIGRRDMPFLWHPGLYHYGANWRLPGDGRYTLKVRVSPPEFARHDRRNGRRYAEPVEVTFEGVEVKTGRD